MRSKKIFYFSTSFAAFFMAVFMIGSINQSIDSPEKSKANEPIVVSTSPSDGEEDVARNVVFEITFNETMESTSLQNSTFTLKQGTETVEGTFQYSGNKGLFTTEKSLKAESEYTASLSMGISQLDNNQSENDYSNNEFNNDYLNNEFNDDENSENEENYYSNNGNEWTFTTGGNSDPVETVDLGSAANYVILAHTSIQNDDSSEITGEQGFDPDFKSSKENKTAYWLNNENVDKEEVRRNKEEYRRDKEENRRDKEEAKKEKVEERKDKEAVRSDDNRKKSDSRKYSSSERDSNAVNMDEALEDMITAYNDAAERTPVDFVDYKFQKSDDQAESTWNNDRDDLEVRNDVNSIELTLEEEYQDDSQEDNQRDTEEVDHADSEMDHNRIQAEINRNRIQAEMNRNRTQIEMERNTNESSVTLEPGIYKWNDSVELSSNITLSGNADDVWIFQISEGLTVNRDVEITLRSGAVAENVIWQVAGDVNIGEASHFEGIILSLSGITMKNGASLNGRILAQTDVTLDENTIMEPQVFASVQRTSIDK